MDINNYLTPIMLSLEISTLAVAFVFFSGIFIARLMSARVFKGKSILETFLLLPIVLPPTVVGFLLIIIFGHNSPIGSFLENLFNQSVMFTFWAAVIAAIAVSFPLMYQTVKIGFESIDTEIEEAARVDGASEKKVFLFITLPLALRAVITGTILSFARALGEFGATFMFAGNIPGKTQTTPTAIYVAMESGNMKMAWLWVIAMIAISMIMLFAANFAKK